MSTPYLRPYATAAIISAPIYNAAGDDFAAPTFVAGDVQVEQDGGAFTNIAALPTVASGRMLVALTIAEATGKRIVVRIKDQDGPAFLPTMLVVETTHHQLAMHPEIGLIYRGVTSGASGANTVTLNPAPANIPAAAQAVFGNGVGGVVQSYDSGTGIATFDTAIEAVPDATLVYIFAGIPSSVTPSIIATATRAEIDSGSTVLAGLTTDLTAARADITTVDGVVDGIATDVDTLGVLVAALENLSSADAQAAAEAALQTYLLHKLVANALAPDVVHADSALGPLIAGGGGGGGVVTGMNADVLNAAALAADAVAEIVAAVRADLQAAGTGLTGATITSIVAAVRADLDAAGVTAAALASAAITAIRADIERAGGMLELTAVAAANAATDADTAANASVAAAASAATAVTRGDTIIGHTDTLEASAAATAATLAEMKGGTFSPATDSLERLAEAIDLIGGAGSTPAEVVDEAIARGVELADALATAPRWNRMLAATGGRWSIDRTVTPPLMTIFAADNITPLYTAQVPADEETGQPVAFTPMS